MQRIIRRFLLPFPLLFAPSFILSFIISFRFLFLFILPFIPFLSFWKREYRYLVVISSTDVWCPINLVTDVISISAGTNRDSTETVLTFPDRCVVIVQPFRSITIPFKRFDYVLKNLTFVTVHRGQRCQVIIDRFDHVKFFKKNFRKSIHCNKTRSWNKHVRKIYSPLMWSSNWRTVIINQWPNRFDERKMWIAGRVRRLAD